MKTASFALATAALLSSAVSAEGNFYLNFYSDTNCQNLIASPVPSGDNIKCNTQYFAKSMKADLSNVTSAIVYVTAYTDNNCTDACNSVTIQNTSPTAQYPIAQGQCVSAQPQQYLQTFDSWRAGGYR